MKEGALQITAEEPQGGYNESLGSFAGNPTEPRSEGVPLVVDDRTIVLATDEARIKAQFETMAKEAALAEIQQAQLVGNTELGRELHDAYLTSIAAGHFSWDGKACREARKDWEGHIRLFWLMARRCQPKITIAECREIAEDFPKEVGTAVRLAQGNFPSSLARAERARKREARRKEREELAKAATTNGASQTRSQNPGE